MIASDFAMEKAIWSQNCSYTMLTDRLRSKIVLVVI